MFSDIVQAPKAKNLAEGKGAAGEMIVSEKHTLPSGMISLAPVAKWVVVAIVERQSHMTRSPTFCVTIVGS